MEVHADLLTAILSTFVRNPEHTCDICKDIQKLTKTFDPNDKTSNKHWNVLAYSRGSTPITKRHYYSRAAWKRTARHLAFVRAFSTYILLYK